MNFAGSERGVSRSGDTALRSLGASSGDSGRSATLLAAALLFQMAGKDSLSEKQYGLFLDSYLRIERGICKQIGNEIRRMS